MKERRASRPCRIFALQVVLAAVVFLLTGFGGWASAFTLNVVDSTGASITSGFRWLLEEDNTNLTTPGALVADSVTLSIHNSHAPVVTRGSSAGSSAVIGVPNDKRYFVSVLPDSDYANGGASVPAATDFDYVPGDQITVIVNALPLPTAQISVLVFTDQNPINDKKDEHEQGIGGASVIISDAAGPLLQDAFGNPLGTQYQFNPDGTPVTNPDGTPAVLVAGNGIIRTLTQDEFDNGPNPYGLKVGEALVKYLTPGKYGVVVVPPSRDDAGQVMNWVQTTTIEGTPTIDAWVKANEPKLFVEGFGTGFNHVVFGFLKTGPVTPSVFRGQTFEMLPWNVTPPPTGQATITGRLVLNHLSRPPRNQAFSPGPPVPECWVGLNNPLAQPGANQENPALTPDPAGLYAAPCNEDGTFEIPNVPPGTWQLVHWDKPLDYLFGFGTVEVGPADTLIPLGDVLKFRWFGSLYARVFNDDGAGVPANAQNGFWDPGEEPLAEQNVNIRFRDATIYQAFPTDLAGEAPFIEVFPFFKWLVVEVDFARLKATGMTTAIDHGGVIPPASGWFTPSFDMLTPQPQAALNPNTGNDLSRTETGPVLTQAMHLFLSQTNVMEFGKIHYPDGENGGISGIVFYAVTRAENDPRYAAAEGWEPGIPRVQVNLYRDQNGDGVIDDLDADGFPTKADVDNHPFGWSTGGVMGPEDRDWNSNGLFDTGDAIQIATTDSWDDNKPSGCVQTLPIVNGQAINECADAFGTWNQVRPGVFDGGYAFNSYFPGGIVSGSVETSPLPPGTYLVEAGELDNYTLLKEEDRNVDFGNTHEPSPLLLPPVCVGSPHLVPAELTLFPGEPAPFAGTLRPLCDVKQVMLGPGENSAADFFFFTDVPKAARAVGFVNNDLGAEFNQASPNFGEKIAPKWLPVAFKDWQGNEIVRVYTDEFGGYNALLPSTYTVNVPSPTGVSPNMLTLVLNDPIRPDGSIDPFHDPAYAVTPWTFHYETGRTTYLDTPIVPVIAFAAADVRLDTAAPDLTPVISQVNGPEPSGGPLLCDTRPNGSAFTITSVGMMDVANPDFPNIDPFTPTITRNYGFGGTQGMVTVDGTPMTITNWSDTSIQATLPPGVTSSGRIMVTRGDNGRTTEVGLTLQIIDCSTVNILQVPSGFATIQAAVDAAAPGDLILVSAGAYSENVVVNKPVKIQGVGTGSTVVDANPIPLDRLDAWHARVDALGAREFVAWLLKDPFSAAETPGFFVLGETVYPQGNLQNPNLLCNRLAPDANCQILNPGFPFDVPGQAQIDGFRITGSKAGGGIFAVAGAKDLVISNNDIQNNQGNFAGGVAVGTPDSGFDSWNYNVVIRGNKIHRNGGIQGSGGIAMNEYSNDYIVEHNRVFGNFSRFSGGGIGHRGVSLGTNTIRFNQVLFNETFFNAILALAGDGGGIYVGGDVAGGTGSGNVVIEGNLIQGNLNGAGPGGGIRAFAINGDDVRLDPADDTNWYTLTIQNNMIVNNVTALDGAGIALQDVLRSSIVNNTIANNDSTATAALAFAPGAADSTPQPAGISSGMHSDILFGIIDAGAFPSEPAFSDPVMFNNIVHTNRAHFNSATLNETGGLVFDSIWDLGVLGASNPAVHLLNPDYSILTSLTGNLGENYDDGTNIAVDPGFVLSYNNALRSASVIDEGGNFINILFTPLNQDAGNYHLDISSAAMDAGAASSGAVAAPGSDFDGDLRPALSGFDIGADEIAPVSYSPFGIFRNGNWFFDLNGNGVFDNCVVDGCFGPFGTAAADRPVAGDWDGDGITQIGTYRNGMWYLDNGNAMWDGCGAFPAQDLCVGPFGGNPTDVPIVGNWDGVAGDEVGVFRVGSGMWFLDNGNSVWDGCGALPGQDLCLGPFGANPTDIPVAGDWNADGTDGVGVYRRSNGRWFLDSGNGVWNDCVTDTCAGPFGANPADLPVVGDWDGVVGDEIGVFRNGTWILDNGNRIWDNCATDSCLGPFGTTGDKPVVGRW